MRYKVNKKNIKVAEERGARVFKATSDEFKVKDEDLGWHQISFDEYLSEKNGDKE